MSAGSKILIIKPSSLGDIVHTLPVVHALKRVFPSCTIGWVAQKHFSPLLMSDPAVDLVHAVDIPSTSEPGNNGMVWWQATTGLWRALRSLRQEFSREKYDIVLDLHASFRSGLFSIISNGKRRLGFADAKEGNCLFQNERVAVTDNVIHALDKNLLFCSYLGCPARPEDFFLACEPEDKIFINRFLNKQGIDDKQNIVYACSCARWQSKFWPCEYWAELADNMAGLGLVLIFGGSSNDLSFIDLISSKMKTKTVVAAGKLSLSATIAMLHRSSAFVGLDSGPMHMAAMTKTPVAALFGPTHPERVGPYGVNHVIIRNQKLACLECRQRQCADIRCMRDIKVDQVERELLQLMNSKNENNSNYNSL